MGSKWNRYQPCITTAGGPSPFQACKFPFESKGQSNSLCVTSLQTPSADVDICNEFHAQVSFSDLSEISIDERPYFFQGVSWTNQSFFDSKISRRIDF